MRTRVMAIMGATALVVAAVVVAVLLLTSGSGADASSRLPLSVFARPQTGADRAAYARARAGLLKGVGDVSAGSVRMARMTPWGQPVLLALGRGESASQPATVFSVAWDGEVVGAPLSSVAGTGWALEASRGGAYYAPAGVRAPAPFTRIVVLVPNGVARIRFAYPEGGPTRTVPVIGNVAAVQFPRPCCVLEPEMIWYSSGGSVVGHGLVTPTSRWRLPS